MTNEEMTNEAYYKLLVEHERLSKRVGYLKAASLIIRVAILIVPIVAWVIWQ